MQVRSYEVEQSVDGASRGRFLKDVVALPSPRITLVRKRLHTGARGPAVLLLHGFGQNRYAWHLSRRSLVNHLAREGLDVFNLDLRGHGRSREGTQGPFGSLDPYVLEDVPAAVEAALGLHGGPSLILAGHSAGALVAMAAAPPLGARVRGVLALAAPYLFGRGNLTLLLAARCLAALTPRVGHGLPFPMRAVRALLRRSVPLWELGALPLPVRAWHPGSFEPEVLREYLRLAFDHASLGELSQLVGASRDGLSSADGARDYALAWERSEVPSLVVAGTRDLLAPVSSVRPAHDRRQHAKSSLALVPFGHGDLLLGREAPAAVWPTLTAFLKDPR